VAAARQAPRGRQMQECYTGFTKRDSLSELVMLGHILAVFYPISRPNVWSP
jgi:hypothetical protein